jgi:hypothetical protein
MNMPVKPKVVGVKPNPLDPQNSPIRKTPGCTVTDYTIQYPTQATA